MKRWLAFLLTVILTLSVLSACGASDKNGSSKKTSSGSDSSDDVFHGEDDITLTLWVPENTVTLTKELCDDFIFSYPEKNITVNVVAHDEKDAADGLIASPYAADVFCFPCDQTNKLMRAGLLAPVSSDHLEDVTTRNFVFSLESATQGGELVAYPETGENGYYLVYDKSVISDEEAQSLESILQACRDANKKFVMNIGDGFYACMFLFTGGLYINGLAEDGTQLFSEYNEETVLDSLYAFAALFHEYGDVILNADTKTLCSGLAEKPPTVAAGIDGSWDADSIAKYLGNNYGAAKLPTVSVNGTDTQIFSVNGSKLVGVNPNTDYPYAAQALADHLTGEECQKARLETLNWLPSNINVLQSDTVRNSPTLSALAEQSEYCIPMINVSDRFWDPVGALGNTLFSSDDFSRTKLKQALDQTLSDINVVPHPNETEYIAF